MRTRTGTAHQVAAAVAKPRVDAAPPSIATVDLAAVTRTVLTDLETQVAQSWGRVEVDPHPLSRAIA